MHWFPLTLFSAFCLALADALTKKHCAHWQGGELLALRFVAPAVLLAPLLWIYPPPALPWPLWGWMALLAPLEILAMLLYMLAIRDSPLALTLPYLAFTPVFTVATGYLILGERVSPQGLAGILLVVLGSYLLNLNHFRLRTLGGWLAPLRAVLNERGSRLMLITAVIYGLTSVLGKQAMLYATPESFGPFYFGVIGLAVLAGMLAYRPAQLGVLARHTGLSLAVGSLMALMVVAHFLAIARVEAAYMISVKRSSLLFGIVLGALMLGEGHAARHIVAGALMVGGVALILL